MANSSSVAVLDLGSNSIKVLVATRGPQGGVVPLAWKSLDARISAGISAERPRLSEEGMARGVAAVQELLAFIRPHDPARIRLVATSAVRDAANGAEFRARLLAATGHEVRILTGDEEANGIGRGLTADPALTALQDFHVLDLGGGSLEWLTFRSRRIEQALSLQLGCVRLTEKFVPAPDAPFGPASRDAIRGHTVAALRSSGARLDAARPVVATGGTVSTVRAVLGARRGLTLDQTEPIVTVAELSDLLDQLAPLPLEERRRIPAMPPARADVFPAALATILAFAETGGFTRFHHSVYNLRYGLAAEMLNGA